MYLEADICNMYLWQWTATAVHCDRTQSFHLSTTLENEHGLMIFYYKIYIGHLGKYNYSEVLWV